MKCIENSLSLSRVFWVLILASLIGFGACDSEDSDPGADNDTDTDTDTDDDTETDTETDTGPGTADPIDDLLEAIEGMEVQNSTVVGGCIQYNLWYEQPADHDNPTVETFRQQLKLKHCSEDYPMVLTTAGYGITSDYYPSELASLFDANLLMVEHRFFDPSVLDTEDWSLLNIYQSANDHHRIVVALKTIYAEPWVNTGASKGGMTAIYHRRHYPDDVTATVAYVAPHTGVPGDTRYQEFLEQVGTEECRQDLIDFQVTTLERREVMVKLTEGVGAYTLMGAETAFEKAVIRTPFAFWQYQNIADCKDIPDASSTDKEVWDFLETVGRVVNSSDPTIAYYRPYYFQAATQLGYPKTDHSYLLKLLVHDHTTMHPAMLPEDYEIVFDPAAMEDISNWIDTDGERLLFIYGENDPWTAGMFELGGATDAHIFMAPGANHGARITLLEEADQKAATDIILKWVGADRKPDGLDASTIRIPETPLL